jgi:class 3 adenylate cyclase
MKHVTLLFTDMTDSTELINQLGDLEAYSVFQDHNAIVRSSADRHAGTEADNAGDGFLLSFQSPESGVRCAIEIQQRLRELNSHRSGRSIRVPFGRNVVLAARLAAKAEGGEVLISESLQKHLDSNCTFEFSAACLFELKGFRGFHRASSLSW